MDGLFLLVGLVYIPVPPSQYANALTTTRDAAFIQSGLKTDWDTVRLAAEKRIPIVLKQGAAAYTLVHDKCLEINTRSFGSWTAKPGLLKATFSWGF